MRLGAIPQNVNESIALAAGLVPTPLIDTLVALLLAKTIMAATAIGIFQALEGEPLTTDEIAQCCGSDRQGTAKLVWALFACRYLKYQGSRGVVSPWLLSPDGGYRGTPSTLCIQPSCIEIWTYAS